jgi:phosphotransferase system enzyme I (PtsP)
MFPMVATVAEYRAARGLLYAEAARVRPAPSALQVGTMLEVPALLWQLPDLLRDTDFVSIGSNDLMQFLFAADRGTPALAGRYDVLSPPVLDILAHVRRLTAAAGVALSVCGEIASRPLEALTLLALGITSLSMPAASLLPIKGLLRDADLRAFRPVLQALRDGATGESSLRDPIASWVREHGLEP